MVVKINNHKYDESDINKINLKIHKIKSELTKRRTSNNGEKPATESNDKDQELNLEGKDLSHSQIMIDELEIEISNLLEDNNRLKHNRLEMLADIENIKKRLNEEYNFMKKFRSFTACQKILPVLDNFERALNVQNVSPEIKNFLLGFNMIYADVKNFLKEEGVEEIPAAIGDEFNHDIHSAVDQMEQANMESNKIINIILKGYKLHGRILRHASVVVSK